jgi:hypothetical protein
VTEGHVDPVASPGEPAKPMRKGSTTLLQQGLPTGPPGVTEPGFPLAGTLSLHEPLVTLDPALASSVPSVRSTPDVSIAGATSSTIVSGVQNEAIGLIVQAKEPSVNPLGTANTSSDALFPELVDFVDHEASIQPQDSSVTRVSYPVDPSVPTEFLPSSEFIIMNDATLPPVADQSASEPSVSLGSVTRPFPDGEIAGNSSHITMVDIQEKTPTRNTSHEQSPTDTPRIIDAGYEVPIIKLAGSVSQEDIKLPFQNPSPDPLSTLAIPSGPPVLDQPTNVPAVRVDLASKVEGTVASIRPHPLAGLIVPPTNDSSRMLSSPLSEVNSVYTLAPNSSVLSIASSRSGAVPEGLLTGSQTLSGPVDTAPDEEAFYDAVSAIGSEPDLSSVSQLSPQFFTPEPTSSKGLMTPTMDYFNMHSGTPISTRALTVEASPIFSLPYVTEPGSSQAGTSRFVLSLASSPCRFLIPIQ